MKRKKQRPSAEKLYWLSPAGLARIRYHRAIEGYSEERIAKEIMGIAYSTLQEWKKTDSGLSAALKSNKSAEIARAFEQLDRSSEGGVIAGKVTTKYQYKYDEDGNEVATGKEVTVTEEKQHQTRRPLYLSLRILIRSISRIAWKTQ